MSLRKAYLLIFIILIVDQVSKIYVKTSFVLGEEVEVLDGSRFYSSKMKEWHGVLKFQEPTVNYSNTI
jgi:lipoprotein signal peptidase